MAFDNSTRNRLQRLVSDCRELLTREFDAKLQELYGIYAGEGRVLELDRLPHLDDEKLRVATLLRERINHLASGGGGTPAATGEAVKRVLREQAFTVLNRFAALRMAEERGIIVESVGGGLNSKGFKTFSEVAYSGLGSAYERYRIFLGCMFDEMATDLGVLFDRRSPYGVLFPRESILLELFELLNAPEVKALWREDETIGWIYQYFNDPAERKRMREESAAPRNSRELAVRNQFFTPRYVVEFLTDNTLGRIWYEMLKGQTKLKDQCRYLVRRPDEYFLHDSTRYIENVRPDLLAKGLADLPEDPTWNEVQAVALCLDDLPSRLCPELGLGECHEFGERKRREFESSGQYEGTFFELFCCLYFEQRDSKWSGQGDEHPERRVNRAKTIYRAIRAKSDGESSNLTQEELLKQPVFIPHRPLKDPREIRMLDPACGSMHFGLYAFDLFEVIYEEYWDLTADGGDHLTAALSPAGGEGDRNALKPLTELYPDKQAFLRDVPRLIIEHNLHGIDIDPRCAQIAGLSLWLRAQKAWQGLGLKPAERPAIKRSNIVCAEPMPGEKELLREFVEREFPTEERGVFLRLLETIFGKMQLAGEAGSLLKIEDEIRSAITEAKTLWKEGPQLEQSKLFAQLEPAKQKELKIDLSGITDEQFWDSAESRIYAALREYAEQAENGGGFQRRLFAEDAARGFAFIDVCRKRFDVVLMNPPFGEPALGSKAHIIHWYPRTKNDLYAAFTERWLARATICGRLGAITSRTGFFLSHFQSWREDVLLANAPPVVTADLGYGVLDTAMVETAAYCLENRTPSKTSLFFGLLFEADKGRSLFEGVQSLASGNKSRTAYLVELANFRKIPRSPFAYWASQRCVSLFSGSLSLESNGYRVRKGLDTNDDFRFFRLWWEVPIWLRRYVPLAKGGAFARYYSEICLVFDWTEGGEHLRAFLRHRGDHPSRNIRSEELYFQAGFTWSQRSQKGLSVRLLPSGCIFSTKGPGIIPRNLDDAFEVLGLVNSSSYAALVGLQMAFGSYDTGILKLTPLPAKEKYADSQIGALAGVAFHLVRAPFRRDEAARHFVTPALSLGIGNISDRFIALRGDEISRHEKLSSCLKEIDRTAVSLYGLDEQSIATQKRALPGIESTGEEEGANEEEERGLNSIDQIALVTAMVEYCSFVLGVCFGRWDIRYSTGEKAAPELPDPFAPLPVCPPGQLQTAQGLPVEKAESRRLKADGYPIEIPWDGILVDDPGHPLDIERRIREVIEATWGGSRKSEGRGRRAEGNTATPEQIEQEACEILGVKSLREYFQKPASFFADHLKRYSKSRRQAPIYWPLSTASGGYTLWIYYHRLTDQTLFQCVNDFVKPKIAEVEGDLARLQKAEGRGQKEREEQEHLTVLRAELVEFRDELLRVAQLPFKPNLNDGVLITASPLWKLFRFPKWQRDLKACWLELEKGEYDWAHLAYTLWPDRVKDVCKKDRSIAIAHGLEDLCEIKAREKKVKERKKPKTEDEQPELNQKYLCQK